MITPNYLDVVLWQFTHVVDAGFPVLRPIAAWLFWTMAGIYLLWSCSQVVMKAKNPLEIILAAFFSFMKVFFFDAMLDNYERLQALLVKVLTDLGLAIAAAGGTPMTPEQFLSPGTILAQSWKVLDPMIAHWNTLSGLGVLWYAGPILMYFIAFLTCIASFLLISAHVLTAIATYRLLALFSYPLLAMGILPQTSFLAKECLAMLVSGAVRLGVLALVCSIILPLITRLALPAGSTPDFWSALSTAGGSTLLALMSWKAPSMAAEMFGRRIAMAAGDLLSLVAGGSYGAVRLAGGVQQVATRAASVVREAAAEHRSSSRLRQVWRTEA